MLTRIGGISSIRLLSWNKQRYVGSRLPIARDRIFVNRPVPAAVESAERPSLRLQRSPSAPSAPRLLPVDRTRFGTGLARRPLYMQLQYITRKNANSVGVPADHLSHRGSRFSGRDQARRFFIEVLPRAGATNDADDGPTCSAVAARLRDPNHNRAVSPALSAQKSI